MITYARLFAESMLGSYFFLSWSSVEISDPLKFSKTDQKQHKTVKNGKIEDVVFEVSGGFFVDTFS